MVVNAAPTGGYVDASPRAGSAAVDTFSLQSLEWTDEVDDLPLLYSFAYMNDQVSGSLLSKDLSMPHLHNQSRFVFPGGARVCRLVLLPRVIIIIIIIASTCCDMV